jgi:uncharacterized protein with PIN domain
MARTEDRVLLTRDVELTRRRGLRCLLIESDAVERQVEQVSRAYQLTAREAFSRCVECNFPLENAEKTTVQAEVPPYVFQTQDHFRRCPRCRRVYWRGTHWARMLARLEDLSNDHTESGGPVRHQ